MSTNPYLLASSFSFGFVSNSFSRRPSVSLYRLLVRSVPPSPPPSLPPSPPPSLALTRPSASQTAASIAEPACRWEYLIDHNICRWRTMLALGTFFLGTPFCQRLL